ncbi:hypothetical protein [Hankyongella ginsenosidimutans]|uniref:hypothetical protein n=1 Tax=Hankyongella ginsenosidimutans TaxID=1763828 RepID=UPI001FEA2D4E|nr:hypothetical protein [Hankyongella ginsenosidimutans]
MSLRAGPATAQLHMAFGENFPLWHLTAVCDDGAVIVDCFRNTVARVGRTRLLEAADTAVSEVGVGLGLIGQSLGGFAGYLGAQLKLVGRQDAFFQSMRASIESFHTAVSARQVPPLSGAFGTSVVGLAEEVAIKAGVAETAAPCLQICLQPMQRFQLMMSPCLAVPASSAAMSSSSLSQPATASGSQRAISAACRKFSATSA